MKAWTGMLVMEVRRRWYNMKFNLEAECTRLSDVLNVGMRERCQEFTSVFLT